MRAQLAATLAIGSIGLACASVDVAHIDDSNRTTAEGQRFALPSTFLQLTRGEGGALTAEPIYLPDQDATFAIDAPWWRLNATTEVRVAKGLVTTINLNNDDAAVLSTILDQGATAAAAELTERKAAEQKESTDLAAARLEVQLAQAQVGALNKVIKDGGVDSQTIIDAQKKLTDAQTRLAQAQAKLASLETKSSRSGLAARSDSGAAAATPLREPSGEAGTLFFKVEETLDSTTGKALRVRLVPVAAPTLAVGPPKPKPVSWLPDSPIVNEERKVATLTLGEPWKLDAVDATGLELLAASGGADPGKMRKMPALNLPSVDRKDASTVEIVWQVRSAPQNALPPAGRYLLRLPVALKSGSGSVEPKTLEKTIQVQ